MAFTFHANTLGFGGQIDRPGHKAMYLPSQASLTLPPSGGYGESSVSNYAEDGVSFHRAESRVFGNSFNDTIFKTYANVTVLGLDIQGRIQADVLSTTVTSINERKNGCTTESRISFDATMVGLVIDGQPIGVEFDPEPFRRYGTFGEFVESFNGLDEKQMAERAAAYNWPFDECQTRLDGGRTEFHVPKRCTTGVRASLLRSTTPSLAPGLVRGVTRQGFSIEVAGLGLVHIGEVLLKTGRRRVNLLRVELGKTLGDLPTARISLPSGGDEPRLHTFALTDGPTELTALNGGVGADSGGYTVASGEGNGTDFLP